GDGVHARGRAHGAQASAPADPRGPVPPRGLPHRARPRHARELAPPHARFGRRAVSLGRAIQEAVEFRDVPSDVMEAAMETLLRGDALDAQVAALAVALRMKGETTDELVAAVRVLRRHASVVSLGEGPILDTCGTGGDGLSTFNISTVSALVVAATGVRVAK